MFEIERSKITVKLSPLDLKMMDSFRIRVGLNKHVTSSYYQQFLFLLLFESLRITILFLSSFFFTDMSFFVFVLCKSSITG